MFENWKVIEIATGLVLPPAVQVYESQLEYCNIKYDDSTTLCMTQDQTSPERVCLGWLLSQATSTCWPAYRCAAFELDAYLCSGQKWPEVTEWR